MNYRAFPIFVSALLIVGCSATARFSDAVKNAKKTGRPIVIYSVPRTLHSARMTKKIIVDFIVTASQPLRSVTFSILPYSGDQPMHQATKEFTAKGPFAPNHAYQFRGPRLNGSKHAWPKIRALDDCVSVVGLNVKKADGSVVQVDKNKIGHYVTPNVNEACAPQNFPIPRG